MDDTAYSQMTTLPLKTTIIHTSFASSKRENLETTIEEQEGRTAFLLKGTTDWKEEWKEDWKEDWKENLWEEELKRKEERREREFFFLKVLLNLFVVAFCSFCLLVF